MLVCRESLAAVTCMPQPARHYNPASPMSLSPGAHLGPYTIRAELGHGGMGVVYTAQDPRLDRQVAIKILPPDLTRDDTAKQRQHARRAPRCTNLALTSALRASILGTKCLMGGNPPVGAGQSSLQVSAPGLLSTPPRRRPRQLS